MSLNKFVERLEILPGDIHFADTIANQQAFVKVTVDATLCGCMLTAIVESAEQLQATAGNMGEGRYWMTKPTAVVLAGGPSSGPPMTAPPQAEDAFS